MNRATVDAEPGEEPIRMGSEYASALEYLARPPRLPSAKVFPRKSKAEPQHGSNDSDFGFADQGSE